MTPMTSARGAHGARSALAFLCALVLALILVPGVALADGEYSIDRVDIDATVSTDGSVTVNEMREFDFDGVFHGVYWKIPTGTHEGRSITTSIGAVGILQNGKFVPFTESYSGEDGTYQISEYTGYTQVKLYSAHTDEKAQFVINYTDTNLAARYRDTSELYWKFVSDGWDVESQNVTCTVHLPVPEGASVVGGDNVRAWGHGPLDASLGFSGNDVVYAVPGVGTSEYAEARITFPSEWLPGATQIDKSRLDSIMSQEQQWADQANAKREQARVLNGGIAAAGIALAVASVVVAVARKRRYRREHKPQFDDKYFRDVPSDDHPAVLGALLNEGKPTSECMTAALMQLTDNGYAKLEVVKRTERGFLGSEKEAQDFLLTRKQGNSRADKQGESSRKVDKWTADFLFREMSRLSKRVCEEGGSEDELYFGEIEDIAREHPKRYERALESWNTSVQSLTTSRGFFRDEHGSGSGLLHVLGTLDFLAATLLVMGIVVGMLVWWIALVTAAVLILVALVLFGVANGLDELSPEAIELRAKLEALRRWLKDFTRLGEAVPTDVVLWNRLLVMAVVLGVADEVIEQLKVAAPQVLEDPYVRPVYGWYYYGGPRSSAPLHSFTDNVSTAHRVSTAALAASSSSSGGGGGGGFSGGGGGGGGFGGGGGGGAF